MSWVEGRFEGKDGLVRAPNSPAGPRNSTKVRKVQKVRRFSGDRTRCARWVYSPCREDMIVKER